MSNQQNLDEKFQIRSLQMSDVKDITDIYNTYIDTSVVTFSIKPVSQSVFIEKLNNNKYPFLVLQDLSAEHVVGFAYLSAFRHHDAYSHVAESSLYIDKNYHGQGLGKMLYQALLNSASNYDIKEVIAVLVSPNLASEYLHQSLGFCYQGKLTNVGFKFSQYHNVTLWQKSL